MQLKSRGRYAPRTVYSAIIAALLLVSPARAQQQPADSPAKCTPTAEESPGISQGAGTCPEQDQGATQKDDRIFGVVPNFNTVEGIESLPPLSVGQKFKLVAKGTFDPYEFAFVGLIAGISQADNKDHSYGQGLAGYGRRYAAAFADQALGNFLTGAIFPTLLHEDPRYFQLNQGGFRHRFGYALTRIVVTRRDAGGNKFNYSEFLGNAAAAGISITYHDPAERTFANASTSFADQIVFDFIGNELKEFWPDIHHRLFHGKKAPQESPIAYGTVSGHRAEAVETGIPGRSVQD